MASRVLVLLAGIAIGAVGVFAYFRADAEPQFGAAEYIRTIDGDTIEVRCNSDIWRVRLPDIEADELETGTARAFTAAAFCARLCESSRDRRVRLDYVGKDRYGRLLAHVYLLLQSSPDGKTNLEEVEYSLEAWLLKEGLVEPYVPKKKPVLQ